MSGDGVIGHSSIANNAYLTIQPSSGDEYIVSNIWGGGALEVYMTDGSNEVLIESISASPYSFNCYKWIVSNTYYLKVKNVSGDIKYVGYSGIKTKD
jgi:hypothetical protein